jgi:hypothetical protein
MSGSSAAVGVENCGESTNSAAVCTCIEVAFQNGLRLTVHFFEKVDQLGNVRQSRTTVAYDSHVRRTGSTNTIASSWRQLAVLDMVSYKIPIL